MEAGVYSVIVTDANGCTSSADYTVNDLLDAGIDDLEGLSFGLYPNPSNGVFNVLMHNADNSAYVVSITDISGRTVYTETMNAESLMIDMSDKANGTYMLHVSNDKAHATKRIVLKK